MADTDTTDPQTADPAAAAPTTEAGFPANTPLEQMSVEQREAYWKDKARKHEERVKSLGGLTPEQLAELRAKAERQEALEHELASDAEKRERAARKEAAAEAEAKYLPKLARAHIEGAANGRVPADALSAALEYLDLTKFVSNGDVDTDKVRAFVGSIAPATGIHQQQQRQGPSSSGQGTRPRVALKPGDAGRAAAIKRGFITAD